MAQHQWKPDNEYDSDYCTVCEEFYVQWDPAHDAECPGAEIPCPAVSGEWTCIYWLGHPGNHHGMKAFDWADESVTQ